MVEITQRNNLLCWLRTISKRFLFITTKTICSYCLIENLPLFMLRYRLWNCHVVISLLLEFFMVYIILTFCNVIFLECHLTLLFVQEINSAFQCIVITIYPCLKAVKDRVLALIDRIRGPEVAD